jgi:hypothetical protein
VSVEQFREIFRRILEKKDLSLSQVHNVDETGLLWKTVPENTQGNKKDSSAPGRKLNTERITELTMCANADGSHQLKPVIIGKSAKP